MARAARVKIHHRGKVRVFFIACIRVERLESLEPIRNRIAGRRQMLQRNSRACFSAWPRVRGADLRADARWASSETFCAIPFALFIVRQCEAVPLYRFGEALPDCCGRERRSAHALALCSVVTTPAPLDGSRLGAECLRPFTRISRLRFSYRVSAAIGGPDFVADGMG